MLDKFFKISERGSTVSNEVIGGLTTFLAMAYIIAVNPAMMEAAGIPFNAALTATCFRRRHHDGRDGPVREPSHRARLRMDINAIVAYSLCLGLGVDWRVAMAVVFLEGILILLLVLCGLRKAVMDAIPVSLRRAIGIGIGLFIAFIGLKGGGFIAADESTFLALGDLTSPTAIVPPSPSSWPWCSPPSISERPADLHRGGHYHRHSDGRDSTCHRLLVRARLLRIRSSVPSHARGHTGHRTGHRAARATAVRIQPAHERFFFIKTVVA